MMFWAGFAIGAMAALLFVLLGVVVRELVSTTRTLSIAGEHPYRTSRPVVEMDNQIPLPPPRPLDSYESVTPPSVLLRMIERKCRDSAGITPGHRWEGSD